MRNVDTSIYSAEKPSRIKPDDIDLSNLPRIEKPSNSRPSPLEDSPFFFSRTTEQSVAETPPGTVRKTERNSERKSVRTENRTENRTEKRTENRSENRTDSLPVKRRTKRYSFEFYDDQLSRLKRLKYQVEGAGESITLSDMVREAVDTYLREKDV